jgi:hypothetical protein
MQDLFVSEAVVNNRRSRWVVFVIVVNEQVVDWLATFRQSLHNYVAQKAGANQALAILVA